MAFGAPRSLCDSLFFEVVQRTTANLSVKRKFVRPVSSVFLLHVGLICFLQNPNVEGSLVFEQYLFLQCWIATLHKRLHGQSLDTRISMSKAFEYVLSDDSLPSTDFFPADPLRLALGSYTYSSFHTHYMIALWANTSVASNRRGRRHCFRMLEGSCSVLDIFYRDAFQDGKYSDCGYNAGTYAIKSAADNGSYSSSMFDNEQFNVPTSNTILQGLQLLNDYYEGTARVGQDIFRASSS